MLAIKIKQPDCSDAYFLESIKGKVVTVTWPLEARHFDNKSKAKMEMLKLILDHNIPRAYLSLEDVSN